MSTNVLPTIPNVAELVQRGCLNSIRLSVVRAFTRHFIARMTNGKDVSAAAESYAENVQDLLAGCLICCRAGGRNWKREGVRGTSWLLKDAFQAKRFCRVCMDQLLDAVAEPPPPSGSLPAPLDEQFMKACSRGTGARYKKVGAKLLEPDVHHAPHFPDSCDHHCCQFEHSGQCYSLEKLEQLTDQFTSIRATVVASTANVVRIFERL